MKELRAWLEQPTSVSGLATIFGALSALLGHQITAGQAIPLLSAGLVSILVRDNSVARIDETRMSPDVAPTQLTTKETK